MYTHEEFFVWDGDPILFTIPEFTLPFPITAWGLIIGAILALLGWQKFIPNDLKSRESLPFWKPWAVILGGLLAGQLLTLPFGLPTIETVDPFNPRWYGLFFALSFILGYILCSKMLLDGGRTQEEMDRLLIYILIATIIGARFGHIFFYELEFYMQNPQLIPAIWRGGLASHGAAIGILLALWLFAKRTDGLTFLWIADRVVPAVAIGGIFIRIGNFFNSEILGKVTDVSWAVIFLNAPGLSNAERLLPRHPSMIYESISALLVLIVLLTIYYRYKKNPPEGALFGTFLAMLFTGRFLIEFTKLHHADFEAAWMLNMGQWLSIPLVAFGLWLLISKVDWSKQGPNRRKKNSRK